jgi:hypothetical protein
MKNLSQSRRSPDLILNPGPHEHETAVLTTRPRYSARKRVNRNIQGKPTLDWIMSVHISTSYF